MSLTVKRVIRLAVYSALAVMALAAWWFLPGSRTEVNLPPHSDTSVPRTITNAAPIYLQVDPRWAEEKVGGVGEPFKWVGCTICCLSMALEQHGVAMDPLTLNRKLKESGGFTFRGWVKWNAIERISNGRVKVEIPKNPTTRDIDQALAEGSPVIVKVLLSSGVQHWVLLVGRDQQDYLMKDPLGDGLRLEPLTTLKSDIYAVRIIKKTSVRQ